MTLHPIQGHEEIRRDVARAHGEDTLPSPLLIHGAPGVGKQRLALWIAQLLFCETPGSEGPCGECRGCRQLLRLEHPDLHWYFPLPRPKGVSGPERLADALEDARSEELVKLRQDPLRVVYSEEPEGLYLATAQALRAKAQKRPSTGEVQLFIVAAAETLVPQESSPEAANALLKLLEEPPAGTRIILTSNEPGRLLATIRSRTVPLHLSGLPVSEVESFLRSVAEASPEHARKAAELSQGSIGRALGFLPDGDEDGPLEQLRQQAFHLVRAALAGDRGSAFAKALEFSPARARTLLGLFSFVEEWVRDVAATAAGAPDQIANQDARDWLVRVVDARKVDPVRAARAVEAVEEARFLASGNVNPQLIVAGLLHELRQALVTGPGSRARV